MAVERCDECGFDGATWTEDAALTAIRELPARWSDAVAGLDGPEMERRPIAGTWSIGEYVDHVREVLFAMRFVLDSAVAEPGIDLGDPPEPELAPTARAVDVEAARAGIEREALALADRLGGLSDPEWDATAVIAGDVVDARWICRHAVHDATHHLLDVDRLRVAIGRARPSRDVGRETPPRAAGA